MKENIFELTTEELKEIAKNLKKKIEEGLEDDGKEIAGIPTHVSPQEEIKDGTVLAIDWGGTNFRATIVEVGNGIPKIIDRLDSEKEKQGFYRLSAKETVGFNQEKLNAKMIGWIKELKYLNKVTHVGYCFSYPAASRLNGDAILLRWTKGINIPDMIGKPVGESLLNYLNVTLERSEENKIKSIKVINDTVACMFAGLSNSGYDSYIGLIVGTGTNMACLMPHNQIKKLDNKDTAAIPVNLESGNFTPPHLTVIDGLVDAMSNNKGSQRFEKAISGGYLGEIFKTVFCETKIKYDFDGGDLAGMINNPDKYPAEQVDVACWIYERSAKLVAASLAGLVQVLVVQKPTIGKICLAVDGSVFWGKDRNGQHYYKSLVSKELDLLLPQGVSVTVIDKMEDPNMIGAAIAALS
ncbi:MAG: hexokinase [Dysgonamonadaceae bacterium]|jgi:hexokinase|nr:hexokinase [Dysgonamonadaceae bacterium]